MTDQPKQEKPLEAFVEHQVKAVEEVAKALIGLVPPEFRTHSKEALKESIKGFQVIFKSVADAVSEEFDRDEDEGAESSTGSNKVRVEVN